jgi:hypothetical protein
MVMFGFGPLVFVLGATLGVHAIPMTVLTGATGVAFFLGM